MDRDQLPKLRGLVERVARHDLLIVAGAVASVVLMSALYTIFGIGMNMSAVEMTRMARPIGQPMSMGGPPVWSPSYAILIFLMWWVMMIAMMTPSAAPMVLLYTALKKVGSESARAPQLSLLFLCGYLLAWAGFSIVAALAQWSLENIDLADGPMMTLKSRAFAGLVMIAAGVFQFTSLKTACLRHCRNPGHFLAEHSRPGASGALATGMHHGLYCLGCCWALMALLFVGGIMNLYWIVGLAIYVLLEKLVPNGELFTRATGAVLVIAGGFVFVTGTW